jgi:S1-C subfamily serine protease
MTAAHLVAGATKVDVVTPDGQPLAAKVIGADPQTDLALLEVSGGGLKVAPIAGAGPPQVGQTVVAVSRTHTTKYQVGINIVSDRNVLAATGTGIDVAGLVETGLKVTPDMAGGALVDQYGIVVGILTFAPGVSPNGVAIPSSAVRDVQDQLDNSGKVSHGWMGVSCAKDDADLPEGGATVASVAPGSPAASAGLAANDVITRAGGARVSGRADLVAASRALRPQDPLDVQYVRDGKSKTVTVTLGTGDPQVMATYAPDMG